MIEGLRQKQERFTLQLSILVLALAGRGYRARLKEVLRTPEQAKLNEAKGLGISNSLHLDSLAADVYLSRDDEPVAETRDGYAIVGEMWKAMGPDHRWGGDFRDSRGGLKPDIYHVSIEHGGRK